MRNLPQQWGAEGPQAAAFVNYCNALTAGGLRRLFRSYPKRFGAALELLKASKAAETVREDVESTTNSRDFNGF